MNAPKPVSTGTAKTNNLWYINKSYAIKCARVPKVKSIKGKLSASVG